MSWEFEEEGYRYEKVADRQNKAKERAQQLKDQGIELAPVVSKGKRIAATFWGQAWNRNLEHYEVYALRLKPGRSYLKNGQVLDLKIDRGCIRALISGVDLYEVEIPIKPLDEERWEELKRLCMGRIGSVVELLRGNLPTEVMELVTAEGLGLFPEPNEIRFICSCPDYAEPCEHAAAAAYGVGVRLDEKPELLFLLRGVDHMHLVEEAGARVSEWAEEATQECDLKASQLAGIFGIELEETDSSDVNWEFNEENNEHGR